jgi:hypothetical protein
MICAILTRLADQTTARRQDKAADAEQTARIRGTGS